VGWRERKQRASFRGVEFAVESNTGTKGRRVSVRKFAGRDGSEQQDHGRDPDEFDVIAFVFGEDYDLRRDELEDALTEGGPGALVLPSRGDLWVTITRGPITTEQKAEGGYCSIRFSVVVEDRQAGRIKVEEDTRAALTRASTRVRQAAHADFTKTVRTAGLPAKYLATATDAVRGVCAMLRKVQTLTQGLLSPVTALTRSLDQLNQTANTVLSTPSLFATTGLDLVYTALSLHDTVVDNIDRATGLPMLALSPFERGQWARRVDRAAGAVRNFGSQFSALTSASSLQRQDAENAQAVARLVRAGALASTAESYASATFDSASFAIGALERALTEIDALCRFGPTDELYAELQDLRAALTRHMLETASKLPISARYRPPRTVPAVLIAFDLYGDARLEAELVARNRIPHPLFVTDELEVLSP
jgi:prophage DNA circulation protein